MPLIASRSSRNRLHLRRVSYEGFQRADGLYDIEAHLTDTKDHNYPLLTGDRKAGEPIHDMWIRVTVDSSFVIQDIEAVTDSMPYPDACAQITPAYRQLIGASLIDGFRKTLRDKLGGVLGCTHLTELLAYLPTAAIQSIGGLKLENDNEDEAARRKPLQLDRCHALETTTDTVKRFYPTWYRGVA